MWHQKAKGPPDGPPIFLIFVEKLNCPQSQAYQSISPVGTGLSLTDRALGVSLGTSIGNYSPLIAPQPVKLKIRWANPPCGFESHHRHHQRTPMLIQCRSSFILQFLGVGDANMGLYVRKSAQFRLCYARLTCFSVKTSFHPFSPSA